MADIVLATINARFSHASFGLRYLLANLGSLETRARLREFDLRVPVDQIVEALLAEQPRILGLGVYIWNVTATTEVVRALRARRPDLVIVLGGPEVSHEIERQAICALANYVITDEGDFAFAALCRELLEGRRPAERVIRGGAVDVRKLDLPYRLYDARDVAHRVIYVEASRGCPFTCEFCLSSLEVPVRRFPLETLLPAFQDLLDRGVRHFKFVDRTFNLSIRYSLQILEFFLARHRDGLFLHFEMIPDRLPPELKDILRCFPRGSLQFEVGLQTFNEEVAARIRRRQDYAATEDNLRWLLAETGSYIHADLIVGLPGESWDSFARGFDRLAALGPHEIQVNVLKRLRGTPIIRHDVEFAMRYAPDPPYELVSNRDLDTAAVERLRSFGRCWDLFANSGQFVETSPGLWQGPSPFSAFLAFSDAVRSRFGRLHGLSLEQRAEALFDWLTRARGQDPAPVARALWRDLARGARRDLPRFLRPLLPDEPLRSGPASTGPRALARQSRRLGPS
jgi:radical SAM superfamily enzyme YgiQ (UPF0313 family)